MIKGAIIGWICMVGAGIGGVMIGKCIPINLLILMVFGFIIGYVGVALGIKAFEHKDL